jgi:glycogen(starch) synthase
MKPKNKIVIYSPSFLPIVGGLMNVVDIFARNLTQLGYEITVITTTPGIQNGFPYKVVRKPSFMASLRLLRAAHICIQFNVSLVGLPLWILSRKELFISHQSLNDGSWRGKIKDLVANRMAKKNICCSKYVAGHYRNSVALPNPYDDRLFRIKNSWNIREKDILFVGRLVSDKGTDLLIDAIYELVKAGYNFNATIVGDGPERSVLMEKVEKLGLKGLVHFAGTKTGELLIDIMNDHKYMVVPSKWEEPFGIVALEGIACGCVVLGSSGGGLGEAIGDAGVTFTNGDLQGLVLKLKKLLDDPVLCGHLLNQGKNHIEKHGQMTLTKKFIGFIHESLD